MFFIILGTGNTTFMVGLSANKDLVSTEVLVFDKVYIDEGGNYNVNNGAYVAPVSGVYVFYYNGRRTDTGFQEWFLLDGTRVGNFYNYHDGGHPSYDASILLYVEAGQMVQMEIQSGGSLYGQDGSEGPLTWFYGYLVSAS